MGHQHLEMNNLEAWLKVWVEVLVLVSVSVSIEVVELE